MPEINIDIGGRTFQVACQTGEEHFLQTAAKLLDNEASVLADQIGRMPETRMLLMAGLMLADKTAGVEEDLRAAEDRLDKMRRELESLKSSPPQTVEVPVIPASVTDTLAEIAARSEALAEALEAKRA
ncbi:cell division protein ZapA [Litoreibacter halocynthiae]|uniref:Cell division protein ZapA n=2 Tax=Litoreibacter TaxID=947567 RepID=A0A4R7LR73_9RHOB|nr:MULTISPECIES: cell division protein ZapA [Litoreibacter]TDT78029.1 cell division protein ZapA [Litoreibacter halocynthiae]SHE34442.1 cell division protein ZapA [Litoreibacter ascidiaceicola]